MVVGEGKAVRKQDRALVVCVCFRDHTNANGRGRWETRRLGPSHCICCSGAGNAHLETKTPAASCESGALCLVAKGKRRAGRWVRVVCMGKTTVTFLVTPYLPSPLNMVRRPRGFVAGIRLRQAQPGCKWGGVCQKRFVEVHRKACRWHEEGRHVGVGH